MKRIIEWLCALAILAGAVFWLYGDRLWPQEAAPEAAADDAGPARGGPGGGRGGNRAATVTLEAVDHSPYALSFEAIGSVTSAARVDVLAETSGRVEALLASPGETIAEGAALLRLDQRAEELDLATARATLKQQAEALARLEQLKASGSSAVSAVQVQEAETAVELAQVAVERAEFALDRRTIRAPIAGRLGLMDVALGDYLTTGTQITTVSEPDRFEIGFALPERAAVILEPGLSVEVRLPARVGQVYPAVVTAVDTEIDPETRLIRVEARLEGETGGLRHGMIANVALSQEQPALPSIPALSIAWAREGASVFVAEGTTVRRVPVTIRHRLDDRVWVEAALEPGARIVVEGVQKVRDGATVQEAERDMAALAPAAETAAAEGARDE